MGEGVIADDVSGLPDGASNIGTLLHVAADHEERCMHVILGQYIEQPQRVRIVWPVIEGERDFFAASDTVGEGLSIPLSGRRHGLIPRRRGNDRSRQSS